eukprot:scaffold148928_cov53-Attheya_sp.AAC.5
MKDTCQRITCTVWCWTMFLAAGGVQATRTFDLRHANSVSISERTALPQLTLERPLLLFGMRRPQGETIALHIRGGRNWRGNNDDGGGTGSYPEEDESRDNYQEYGDNTGTPPKRRRSSLNNVGSFISSFSNHMPDMIRYEIDDLKCRFGNLSFEIRSSNVEGCCGPISTDPETSLPT